MLRSGVICRRRLLLLVVLSLLSACHKPSGATKRPNEPIRLSVAAAASLQFAFAEIETAFEREHPRIQLEVTYGSSGNFFAQLTQGAPFDIFFSADSHYPKQLVVQEMAAEDSFFEYARGRIVVWVPTASSLDVMGLGLRALVEPSVSRIAIANPRLAPYGRAAEEALHSAGIYDDVKSRIVLGENIAQAAHMLTAGAADAGIIAHSLAVAPPMRDRGRFWIVPQEAHQPIEHAAVIPLQSRHREAARELKSFVSGPHGKRLLADHGFSPAEE